MLPGSSRQSESVCFENSSVSGDRSAAGGRATTHGAPLGRVIGQCPVAGAGLVPDGDVAGGPPPPHLHLRVVDLAMEHAKHSPAVGVLEPDDLRRVERRQPHRGPTGFGMQAHHGLFDRGVLGDEPAHDVFTMMPAHRVQQRGVWNVNDTQRPADALSGRIEAFIDRTPTRPQRVATARRNSDGGKEPIAGGSTVQLKSVCQSKPAGGRSAVSSITEIARPGPVSRPTG